MKAKLKRKVLALLAAAIHEYDADPEHNWPALATVGLVTGIKGMPLADSKAYDWLVHRLCLGDDFEPSNENILQWLSTYHAATVEQVFRLARHQGDSWSRVYNRAWLCSLYLQVAGETYEPAMNEMRFDSGYAR